MALTYTPNTDNQLKAPDFKLKGVDSKYYTLVDIAGTKGLVVVFMCNHCPYVQAIIKKMVGDANKLMAMGIGFVGINSNDPTKYQEDSFENMVQFAKNHSIKFPYLFDEDQSVAKAYGAVCTPDFFGFNKELQLMYRGRFDDSGRNEKEDTKRELLEAMQEIARTQSFEGAIYPSMGCSIKWR